MSLDFIRQIRMKWILFSVVFFCLIYSKTIKSQICNDSLVRFVKQQINELNTTRKHKRKFKSSLKKSSKYLLIKRDSASFDHLFIRLYSRNRFHKTIQYYFNNSNDTVVRLIENDSVMDIKKLINFYSSYSYDSMKKRYDQYLPLQQVEFSNILYFRVSCTYRTPKYIIRRKKRKYKRRLKHGYTIYIELNNNSNEIKTSFHLPVKNPKIKTKLKGISL